MATTKASISIDTAILATFSATCRINKEKRDAVLTEFMIEYIKRHNPTADPEKETTMALVQLMK